MKRSDQIQLDLWAVKEAAWKLHASSWWKPGVSTLVASVCDLVNKHLRAQGYDPYTIVKQ